MPVGVVNILLVESPADALHDAALHLAFDIGRVDGNASVLDSCVAQDLALSGLFIHFHIGNVDGESATLARGRDRVLADGEYTLFLQQAGRFAHGGRVAIGRECSVGVRDRISGDIPQVG